MADELKDQRVPIMMSPSEVKEIDDWMFKNRIRSRGEAIRRLCQIGLLLEDEFDQVSAPYLDIIKHLSEFGKTENINKIKDSSYRERLELTSNFLDITIKNIIGMHSHLYNMYRLSNIYRKFDFEDFGNVVELSRLKHIMESIDDKKPTALDEQEEK